METYIIIGLFIIATLLAIAVTKNSATKRKVFKNNEYSYIAKKSVMTQVESEFYLKINSAVRERYYVFPQIHLSALLDHHIKGQDWKYAFSHINGKSVDYVLCNKTTLQPTYAIELDDYTHDQVDRRKRDIEVERIFKEADIPLVRFKNKDVSESDIIQALSNANKLTSLKEFS